MKILNKYNQYIKGTLSEREMDAFTKEVVKEHFEKEQLQDRWKQILQEEHDMPKTMEDFKKPTSSGGSRRYLKIGLSAAASILLLVFSWFSYQQLSPSAYEALLNDELSKPFIEDLSRKGDVETLKLQAVAAYNSREYAVANKYFEQLSNLDQTAHWDFYIGLCQLYQNQADLAIETFTTILDHPNNKYNIEANWYLSLAYTMNEDFPSARKHLELVANRSDDEMAWKVKEAKALLNALDGK